MEINTRELRLKKAVEHLEEARTLIARAHHHIAALDSSVEVKNERFEMASAAIIHLNYLTEQLRGGDNHTFDHVASEVFTWIKRNRESRVRWQIREEQIQQPRIAHKEIV